MDADVISDDDQPASPRSVLFASPQSAAGKMISSMRSGLSHRG